MEDIAWLSSLLDRYENGKWTCQQRDKEVEASIGDLNAAYRDTRTQKLNQMRLTPRYETALDLQSCLAEHFSTLTKARDILLELYLLDVKRYEHARRSSSNLEQMNGEVDLAYSISMDSEKSKGQAEQLLEDAISLIKQADTAGGE